ncbi:MAG: DegT/DnrJ/EryC1/StrS aminotransferase family protein [Nitrospinota bacterium]|nr:DegT/DnrJ/EryC1/StrS aminotransferase family protein [Nitrospinota bacterium]
MSIDLPFHQSWFDDEEIDEVIDTLKSGWLTTGPKSFRFEDAFQEYVGCRHAIALNSCTAGLHLSLTAQGFSPGDEVITTPMTFPATANMIVFSNLKPVFVDIEPGTLNLDANRLEEKISPRTRAILPVHFSGHPCDMDTINTIARKRNLLIVEDAAHALGASYKGKRIGGLGNLTAFSFYANKNITTGEGGMLVTDDDELAEKFRSMRLHGLSRDAWNRFGKSGFAHWQLDSPGYKYNMSDINAALGIHQLKKVERFLKIREQYVEMYNGAFRDGDELETLETKGYARNALHLYVVALRLERLTVTRDQFLDALQNSGIGIAVHYIALHLQPFYRDHFFHPPETLPVATRYSERILSLPLYPKMQPGDVERVIHTVNQLITKYRK